MQRGTIVRRRASWTLLYWDRRFRDGEAKRVKVSKKLALFGKEYPTKASVRHLADKILAPINDGQHQPESSLRVSEYIHKFYFPSVKASLRPATIDSYKFVFSTTLIKSSVTLPWLTEMTDALKRLTPT